MMVNNWLKKAKFVIKEEDMVGPEKQPLKTFSKNN
jgi:hypothetical protein